MDDQGTCYRPFPTTHWSRIAIAADRAGGEDRHKALEDLLRRYLPPMKTHLTVYRGMAPDRADDLLQDFVTDKVLQKDLIARADQRRGKFRTFLLTALDRFAIDRARRETVRKKRSGAATPEPEEMPAKLVISPRMDPAGAAWAREVVALARDRLEAECRSCGRTALWEIFRARFLDPLLSGVPPLGYRALASSTGIESPTQAANVLVTAKRMFTRQLRAVVAEYASGDEVDEEIAALRQMILADSRAGSGDGTRR